jgi:hypothetical protein
VVLVAALAVALAASGCAQGEERRARVPSDSVAPDAVAVPAAPAGAGRGAATGTAASSASESTAPGAAVPGATATETTGAQGAAQERRYGIPRPAAVAVPQQETFQGCPPEGDGGDAELNRLKNRIDEPAAPVPVHLDSILKLPWPDTTENRRRSRWGDVARETVSRFEGIPVVVTGYVLRTRMMDPESPNCHGAERELRDWHIWLTSARDTARTRTVIAETTPRVRARHPNWSVARLGAAARLDTPVRITGWLLLDQEHPEEVGKSRGTVWEIHPITKIEVLNEGAWVSLDSPPR